MTLNRLGLWLSRYRSALRFFGVALVAIAMSGCGLFEAEEESIDVEGRRISVLQLQQRLSADETVSDVDVTVPEPWSNSLWPQAGGFPSHVMGNLAATDEFDLAWRQDIGAGSSRIGRITAEPVLADGRIYAMDARGVISAYDPEDGARLWRVRIVPKGERRESLGGGLAFAGGLLYAAAGYSEVVALDPKNGGLIWRTTTPAPVRTAPTVSRGQAYVVTLENQLVAMNADTGRVLWEHSGIPEEEGVLGAASPAAEGSLVVVAYSSGELFALRAENGSLAWTDNLSSVRRAGTSWRLADIRALPVIDRGQVYAVSLADRMLAIDQPSGARIWQRDIGSLETPLIVGDFIYLMSVESDLVCMIRSTGQVRWIESLPRYEDPEDKEDPIIWTGPIMAGGRLILANSNEQVFEVDPKTGDVLRQWDVPGDILVRPIVARGTLYLLTDDGDLLAYR